MLLVIALHRGWEIRQWDVVAAYLQAVLQHDVYISDINEQGKIEYWKLNKALYGLKQAGHEWYKMLQKILKAIGITQCIGDEGAYTSKNGNILIGTHVDDLIGIAPYGKDLDTIETNCEKTVELEKRGKPAKMLGMELMWGTDHVVLTQRLLIETMADTHLPNDHGRNGEKLSLPVDPESFKKSDDVLNEPKKFQAIVGGLLFINRMTRPDISIQVNLLGRRAWSPSPANLKAAMDTLRYLWSSRYEGIILKKPKELRIEAFADASYGGEESRSQSGVLLTLGKQPIGWYSRRQDIVTLSITEAEYLADCEGAKDIA